MPPSFDLPASMPVADLREDEAQMRRSLGIGTRSAKSAAQPSSPFADRHSQRRRFVNDGEVPVVVLGRQAHGADATASPHLASSLDKIVVLEAALKTEQDGRHKAERSLAEAHAIIRDLQTRLGHATLERDEAREAARVATAHPVLAPEPGAAQIKRRGRPPGSTNRPRQVMQEDFLLLEEATEPVLQQPLSEVPAAASAGRPGRPMKLDKGIRKARTPKPKPVKWW